MSPFRLRPYQQDAVDATVKHFRKSDKPAVIVLPTGAGKSLVIAELAKIARGRVLVLAHVKELVEQNYAKYLSYGLEAGVFSAGLKQKQATQKVIFGSVQSVGRNLDAFDSAFSLVIIDECHRVASDAETQYQQVITHLKQHNPRLKVLGLTATPYRLGVGWIYQYHYHGIVRSQEARPFDTCIYELPLRYMLKHKYLTSPDMVDAPVAQYDFSALVPNAFGELNTQEVNRLLVSHQRVTQAIVEQIVDLAQERQGVMIFAATVKHAEEIEGYLAQQKVALITAQTPQEERDKLILAFKEKQLKYLVNVSVLTTGFDAPHVDMIAVLRTTQSVSLYQQIVGRGLRLSEGKRDCLVIDYAGNGFDLFYPEVGQAKPAPDTEAVQVLCPSCGFANVFWGRKSADGQVTEHFGRKCQGFFEQDGEKEICDYRFRFKECDECGAQNDIAARVCHQCDKALVDPDDKLKAALRLKDAKVIRCAGVSFSQSASKLTITYHDEDGEELKEVFDFSSKGQLAIFNRDFGQRFNQGQTPQQFSSAEAVMAQGDKFRGPDFVVARKSRHHWRVQERIFDYQGRFRKANEMH